MGATMQRVRSASRHRHPTPPHPPGTAASLQVWHSLNPPPPQPHHVVHHQSSSSDIGYLVGLGLRSKSADRGSDFQLPVCYNDATKGSVLDLDLDLDWPA
jgi:hypothetical protein